jgi:sugar phosphate isomerase/epimerase
MRRPVSFLFFYLFLSVQIVHSQQIPKLGIASAVANDSVLYHAGFSLIGESVSRMVSPRLSEAQFEKNIQTVKSLKCQVYMCNVFFPADIKLVGPALDEKKVLSFADTVFQRASALGVYAIVLGSGGPRRLPEGYSKEAGIKEFVALSKKLAQLAGKHNIKIFLENLNSTETNFITSLKEAAEVVKSVNHPNFKLNADIYHMMKENESPQSIIDAGAIIEYCEIAEKDERTYPGFKKDDFVPYLKALKQIGYKGHIFIEGRWTDLKREAPIAKAYLEQQLKLAYQQ